MASTDETQPPAAGWIAVPRQALRGEGLAPYQAGETASLVDWVENPEAGSAHVLAHAGQLIVDVVEIEANAVHQPSKPGDELVVVLNGTLSLTSDATGGEELFRTGEMVLIPAGWAGTYRVSADQGRFLELALVPHDYFDVSAAPPPSGKLPRRIEPPREPGLHAVFKGRYLLEADIREAAGAWQVRAGSDEVIQVLGGTLTLGQGSRQAAFPAGSVVVLPQGFEGSAQATADYRALIARWLG